MSEFDEEATARIVIGEWEYDSHRWNTSVFTHIGELAMYDHVYLQTEDATDEDSEPHDIGIYIFRHSSSFAELGKFARKHKFPMHLNKTEVAECDKAAFELVIQEETQELDAGIPKDWVQ